MPIYHDGKKMKPYRGYRKPVNVYYGDKKVAGWKNSTQTGNNLTFQTTYNDTADVVVKGKSLQKSEWVHKTGESTQSNPMINRVPEHGLKFEGWYTYQGASVTLTQNISVSEWGTDEATRIQITGGTDATKYYYSMSAVIGGGPLPNGRKTQILVDVKNIGTAPVRIACNLDDDVIVNPGETKSVTVNGTGNGNAYWALAFKALSASDNLDFIAYNPRAYILDEIPLPDNPFPITSNLPAGTYKVADYKGDWWEFTLNADLCGIGDVRDAVEWDKYGHKGFESRKIGQILSYTDEIIETAYMSTTGGLDTGAHICYVLATPTRTPLTFTKNNDSTAPECPMEFLTDTPSLEYPAEVFDASGTVKARGKNLFKFVTATIPPLRSNADGTVCDEFEVKTGKATRKIGRIESYNGEDVGDDWISSTGALDTGATVEYVLAEPIEEQHDPATLPTYYPTTVITTANDTPAELTTTATVKVEET